MTEQTTGQRIAQERKKLGLSQEALAAQLDVSRQAVSKWESDTTMPDVDKLITLSRLFGVSVGWLLTAESLPEPTARELTPEQLELVETMVKKYTAQAQLPRKFWLIQLATLLMAMAVLGIQSMRLNNAIVSTYEEGMRHGAYQLEQRIEELENQVAAQAPHYSSLLADYSFETELLADSPRAMITFTGIPHSWEDPYRGYLCVTGPNAEPVQVKCQWEGGFLTASVVLDLTDGWKLSFAREHSGVQEMQPLFGGPLETLAASAAPTLSADIQEITCRDGQLILTEVDLAYGKPELYEGSQVTWLQVDLVLRSSEEELTRYPLVNPHDSSIFSGGGRHYGNSMTIPLTHQPGSGEQLTLDLEAVLSSGLSTSIRLGSWTQES